MRTNSTARTSLGGDGGDRSLAHLLMSDPLRVVAAPLITLPLRVARGGLRFGTTTLSTLTPVTGKSRRRTCTVCGRQVRDGEPFLRYRGGYYHAAACIEVHPPALARARVLARRGGG